jgi:hypothetical protein
LQDKVEQVENKCEGKTLEEYLAEPSKATSSAHKLEVGWNIFNIFCSD